MARVPALPHVSGCLPRPRLLRDLHPGSMLVAQAPAGAGKTTFLLQWASASARPLAYLHLDERDRTLAAFAARIAAQTQQAWPEWEPSEGVLCSAEMLVQTLVEQAALAPLVLVLDGLEAAFGAPHLAAFLVALAQQATPNLLVGLGTRTPLPVEWPCGRPIQTIAAPELAFTRLEAEAFLGAGDWEECHALSGGLPAALAIWRHHRAGWRETLSALSLAGLPGHLGAEHGRALVREWLGGALSLEEFAYQVSQAPPGAEQLWQEVREVRSALLAGEVGPLLVRLHDLQARAEEAGNARLQAALALLEGEARYIRGEYGQAMECYRTAFALDPLLETTGAHSIVLILRDQGYFDEAEVLARRCLAARKDRGDQRALVGAMVQYGAICAERGRVAEAEEQYREAERLGLWLAGEPFYGILAMLHRAMLHAGRGDILQYRQVAEEAMRLARGRSPWLEAMGTFIRAGALSMWGEWEAARPLLEQARTYLEGIEARWQLHLLLAMLATATWASGQQEQARVHFDEALRLAAREGYVSFLYQLPRLRLPLILDALARGIETAFCQELLVRMGSVAVPALVEMTRQQDPHVRRAAIYPLSAIGGEEALVAIRGLLDDEEERVRDRVLLVLQSLNQALLQVPAVQEPEPPGAARASSVRVGLLGLFTVQICGQVVQNWRTAKTRDLLAYLALAGERPVAVDQIVEALWPEADAESGRSLLHTTLYFLRRALKPAGEGLILFAGGAYRLDRLRVEVDLSRFEACALADGEVAWREAVECYRGDLLDGLDYVWCEAPRARARQLYLQALRGLSGLLVRDARWCAATEYLQLLIQTDPLAEDAHLSLMEAYVAQEQRSAAMQQYQRLLHVLDEELGLRPSPMAEALYRRLLG